MLKFLTALLFVVSTVAYADSKSVQVVWPFAAGSPQANMIRAVIETANANQNKYSFVFVNKPGAGGTVAASYVRDQNDLTILASTSSFYIRPMLYKDSHIIDDFKLASVICTGQPLAIYSRKVSKISEASERDVSIGVIPGSITALLTRTIKRENPQVRIIEVPYKGTPEATTDMLGGHIDGAVEFVGKTVAARFDSSVHVLGITGTRSIHTYQTFQSQKIKGLEGVTNDYFMFVSDKVSTAIRGELNAIFNAALQSKTQQYCEEDYGIISRLRLEQVDILHSQSKVKWEQLTKGIVRE
jgi:tripartite-type tricarboxylate transporter receptor subunit TctC